MAEGFLCRVGASALVRSALLQLLEARPADPVCFLEELFGGLSQGATGKAGTDRALWYLRLAPYCRRTAFNNNVIMAYECLCASSKKKVPGLTGKTYSELLSRLCKDALAPNEIVSPLLKKIQCRNHEVVHFDVFRHGILTCFVLLDYVAKAGSLYDLLRDRGDADERVCMAVLETLEEALEASNCSVPASYLEAGTKLGPDGLALAMDRAFLSQTPRSFMLKEEFLSQTAALFLAKVKPIN